MPALNGTLGVVAIGRNEGERLRRCLQSVGDCQLPAVYVDSGSTDDSLAIAQSLGVSTLPLDMSTPFTAARARDEGFAKLLTQHPATEWVLFLDGDCELEPTWPAFAVEFLHDHPRAAVAAGRRRERFPDASVYNRLCDAEWNTGCGEVQAIGGDFVIRVEAYRACGGFDPSVPAGEEPELCKRLRDNGWQVWRLEHEMTLHDAAIHYFGQWWRRQIRSGYGGYDVERRFALNCFDKMLRSAALWGVAMPIVFVLSAVVCWATLCPACGLAAIAIAVLLYMTQASRIALTAVRSGQALRGSIEYAFFTVLSKLPIAFGASRAAWLHFRKQPTRIIEYKSHNRIPGV